MNQASRTGVASSSSSSAYRASSSAAQDEQILSAFGRLRLHPSQAGPQREPASAVAASNFEPAGPAGRASPSTIPRAAGRGRGRTLPAWMTSGEHAVPGGLQHQQVPRESGARARPTGLSSSSPQQNNLQGGQQHVGPSTDTSFQLGVPKTGIRKSKSKKSKNKKQKTAGNSPNFSAGGAGVHGSAWAEPARQPGLAPASEPGAGIWMARPTAAVTSPQMDPRSNVGRGLGTILPAAVSRNPVHVQRGLQEKAPLKSDAAARAQMSRPAGIYSSRPQQSAQSGQLAPDPNGDKRKRNTNTAYESQAAGWGGTYGDLSAQPPATAPPATVASNRDPRAGASAAGGGRGGRERTLPARMTSGAHAAVPGGPGGLQKQMTHGGGAWAHVRRATSLQSARAAAAHQIPDGDNNIQRKNRAINKNRKQQAQQQQQQATTGGGVARESGRSETATSEHRLPPPRVERALGGKSRVSSPLKWIPPSGGEGSAAGRAAYRQASTMVGSERRDKSSKPKRSRDEEQVEGLSSSAPTTQRNASGKHASSSFADPMDVGSRMAGEAASSEPRSKKNKSTLSENKPSQGLVATRSRFKIVHHHAIPQQGQLVVVTRGHGSHPGPSAGDERHAPNPNNAYAYTNTHTNTRIESYSSPAPTLPGRTPFSAQPSPAWAPTNKKPVGSSYFVVIDGNEAAISYSQADGRSSALGPLLAIQFFEERGVESVVFLPRQRVASVTPQSVFYPRFQRARSSGAIASVPAGENHRLFILKHALDKKAFVATNARLHDLAGNNEALAALGQTAVELEAYLSRHQVGFTFVRNELVPNPESPLTRMLTQEASATRGGNAPSRTTTAGGAPPGLPSFPLPRPPPGLSGSRDNPTPSMLHHVNRY